jgi:hypothetical protein
MAETSYDFSTSTAATTWTINHSLRSYPICDVFLHDGRKILPKSVTHPTTSTVIITFSVATSGTARLVA